MLGCYIFGIILHFSIAFFAAFAPIQLRHPRGSYRAAGLLSRTRCISSSNGRYLHSPGHRSFRLWSLEEGSNGYINDNNNHDQYDKIEDVEGATSGGGEEQTTKELAFYDEAFIYVRAGSGGQGSSTYKKAKRGDREAKRGADGIPDGGNGGVGGDVIMVADYSLNTLAGLTLGWRPNSLGGSGATYKQADSQKAGSADRIKSFKAMTGFDGSRRFHNGSNGENVEIRVPPGTTIQEEVDIVGEDGNVSGQEMVEVGVITMENPTLVVAQGGKGGDGSGVLRKAAAKGKIRRRSPPQRGARKKLKLVLKIVADVALVGVPNAGKSTFLASVTRAKPKIADYPFTTVIPNLGVWVPANSDYESATASKGITSGSGSAGLVLCDVPGLVAGAAEGVGLGHAFLRHVERCHVILHLVDATSIDPLGDFNMLNRELARYGSGQLANMPQVVVVNKVDAFGEYSEEEILKLTREELKDGLGESMDHSRLMWMSAKEKEGVEDLMGRMAKFVTSVKQKKVNEVASSH